jgi:hypothetical protein
MIPSTPPLRISSRTVFAETVQPFLRHITMSESVALDKASALTSLRATLQAFSLGTAPLSRVRTAVHVVFREQVTKSEVRSVLAPHGLAWDDDRGLIAEA